jgi:hypothetical protein
MKCPLCDCHHPSLILKADLREYWLCPKCFLIFVPSQFFISKKEEVNRYLEHDNNLQNKGYVEMFQKKINTIKEVCPKVKIVLDYGCGYAPVLKTLFERQGYDASIYDPNFFPEEKPNQKYDLIISTETFEHIKKPREDLVHLIQKISTNGYLAVMTRFYPIKKNNLCLNSFGKWYYKRDPTHIAFYSQKTFSWMADELKMKVCHNNRFDFIILQRK